MKIVGPPAWLGATACAAAAWFWLQFSGAGVEAISAGAVRSDTWDEHSGWILAIVGGVVLYLHLRRVARRTAALEHDSNHVREQVRTLLDNHTQDGVVLIDGSGVVTAANATAEELLGRSRDGWIGKPLPILLARSGVEPAVPRATLFNASEHGVASMKIPLRSDRGISRHAKLELRPLGNGKAGFIGTLRAASVSVTEPSEGLFRAIFERAPIGIAQISPGGRVLRANPHFCALLGRTERDLQASSWTDFTHSDDIQGDIQLVSRCLAGEIDRYTLEKRYLRPDGQVVWVDLFVALVNDRSGNPAYFVSVATDIGWRKAAKEALADGRQRLQSAVEIARVGFWEYNLASNAMYYSREALAQLGLSDGEVSDHPDEYRARIHPDDGLRLEALRSAVLSGRQESGEGEFRFRTRDGSYRDIQVRAVMLRSADGRPTKLLGANLDVTPVRDSERLVRRLSARILRLQDTERRRIARQLHDTTAQNLAALNMNLARLLRLSARKDHDPRETIEECIDLTDRSIQEIRTLAYLLHPPMLDEFGLERATTDYVTGFSQRSGIPVDLAIEQAVGRLSDEVELSLFRVLQESLTNVVRHAACTRARVRLSRTDASVELEISDNGHGIPTEKLERLKAGAPLGVGITGMNERLDQIGGRLEIRSDGAGTTLLAIVPHLEGGVSPR
ncbi:hypothetical protein ASA1KI_07910 [Opitutales bacterium ASA1]|uniref:PAS domain S-box protein n=1 Tax=Congregicoccus parvus TaxID=3081749 RepID=UPI002B29524D|nr:hypothetical protein ASA1KI_07910 [Opitutales bacterium ASA1]